MNHDGDLECTCDIGPFASCPVCQMHLDYKPARKTEKRKKPEAIDRMSAEQYAEYVRSGLHWGKP